MLSDCAEKGIVAARGMRLRRLREEARMSSEVLAQKIDVTRQTLSSWENAKRNGLPGTSALKITKALEKLGLYCDFNWLWYGEGKEPYWLPDGIKEPIATLNLAADVDSSKASSEEIKIFEKNYPDAVIMQVKDMAMHPVFQKGDWIGGCWREISPKLVNQICIVENANSLEVRLIKGRSAKGYHLGFIAYLAETSEPFELVNQNPTRVAPVIRMWRG